MKIKIKEMTTQQRRKYFGDKMREWRKENRERDLELKKKWRDENKGKRMEYRQRSESKARHKEESKRYAKRNPEKIKAHGMANTHLKHLKKSGYEFHHPDYSQPLLVEVLPIKEHRALHAQLNKN